MQLFIMNVYFGYTTHCCNVWLIIRFWFYKNISFHYFQGDSVVRYFEITPEPPFVHYINTFQTPDPQRGIGMMSKRGCDVSTCEITRFYRINNNGFCQVIPFTVPRKSELFQEALSPDPLADVPAITADDWWSGTNTDPILVPMSQEGVVIKKVRIFHS